MADGRMISKGIAYSAQLAAVSMKAELVFLKILPQLDVEGRISGNPDTIKAMALPRRREITVAAVESALRELVDVGLIQWYSIDGIEVVAYPNFRRHQKGLKTEREAPTKLPPYSSNAQDLIRSKSGLGPPKLSKVKLREVKVSEEGEAEMPLSPVSGVTVEVPAPYNETLAALLSRVPEPRTWLIEMRAMLDGMPGHHHATPEQLGRAVCDYLGNGAAKNQSLRQFRNYVKGAIEEKAEAPRNASPMERSIANTKKALEGLVQ